MHARRKCFLFLLMDFEMIVRNLEKERNLLSVLEGKISDLLTNEKVSWEIKQIIAGCRKIQDGSNIDYNNWVLDTWQFNKYRLIHTWHYMCMDLSL